MNIYFLLSDYLALFLCFFIFNKKQNSDNTKYVVSFEISYIVAWYFFFWNFKVRKLHKVSEKGRLLIYFYVSFFKICELDQTSSKYCIFYFRMP